MGTCKNACAWHKELLTYENVAAAANEIERLQGVADLGIELTKELADENKRLRAEVERLTDELQQVANEIALAESKEARCGNR
jgi:regulator of replication initiation timing